jgi:cell division protein FtsW (lipid II flippase)
MEPGHFGSTDERPSSALAKGDTSKTLAFVLGLLIAAIGAVAVIAPASLAWIAERTVTPGAFYVVAVIRVAFGLVLISAASASRAPKTLRVLGWITLIAGIMTALMGLLAIERARAMIEWWLRQETGVARLATFPLLIFGGLVAYACAPARRLR